MGKTGELCIRGPQVMAGYFNRPDETAKVMLPDGFLRTGDVAMVDEEGFVRIVDRKKDMILVSGFNVYPNEVEDVVAQHPGVAEVAAVGMPDERSGEVVKIYVVRRDPGLTEEALIAHCRESLTGYKVPRWSSSGANYPRPTWGRFCAALCATRKSSSTNGRLERDVAARRSGQGRCRRSRAAPVRRNARGPTFRPVSPFSCPRRTAGNRCQRASGSRQFVGGRPLGPCAFRPGSG